METGTLDTIVRALRKKFTFSNTKQVHNENRYFYSMTGTYCSLRLYVTACTNLYEYQS